MKVLVIDVGGSHVKVLVSGAVEPRRTDSGPDLTPGAMVRAVTELAADWTYEAISIGYPGPARDHRPLQEPQNLGSGWLGFDFSGGFGRPVRLVNDALMQAIGSYQGGRMLFLGLGTGLGAALVTQHVAHPLELAHLPYRKGRTFEDVVGARGLKRMGKKKWRRAVADVVERLQAAMLADYTVIGGGNVAKLDTLPPGARRGDNANAFAGGFRLWENTDLRL